MSTSRRQFLWRTAAACGALWAARGAAAAGQQPRAAATLDPDKLRRWISELPRPAAAHASQGGLDLTLRAAEQRLHPELPPTRLWAYNGVFPGPTIEARAGEALSIRWHNRLPAQHFLPVDHTLAGAAAALPPVRAVAHVHGARVPADSDGYPEQWSVAGETQTFRYPNRQPAATLYYHDHAMGLGRLNIYAGLSGFYLLRDEAEAGLQLPNGEAEMPLLLCDRWLDERGQLYYPVSGIKGHPWVPEVEGNCLLVNGVLWPRWRVEARAYRLRLCNGANTRSFRLGFSDGTRLHVIGTDQGFLPRAVTVAELTLAPGERADVLVDFRPAAGEAVYLTDGSRAILRVEVAAAALRANSWRPPRLPVPVQSVPAPARTRRLTLNEYDDAHGAMVMMLLDGKRWEAPVSESPALGDSEVWEFLNLTGDTHPIHLHEVRFRILDRRPFDAEQYQMDKTLRYTGAAQPPAPEEDGWKDTVRCFASEVTRIGIQFEGYAGRYVWHCHLLEHADNAMMRPYEIRPRGA
ncbi:MAG TPA: multicopper oxidase domain-containing protein [Terriglobales bacterium]|nr:multicopper oxidase domain-containing protein [Terriglobales bacterium]